MKYIFLCTHVVLQPFKAKDIQQSRNEAVKHTEFASKHLSISSYWDGASQEQIMGNIIF